MTPGNYIKMKIDNRYRNGNIVCKHGVYVGNEQTMSLQSVSIGNKTVLMVTLPLLKKLTESKE